MALEISLDNSSQMCKALMPGMAATIREEAERCVREQAEPIIKAIADTLVARIKASLTHFEVRKDRFGVDNWVNVKLSINFNDKELVGD